MRDDSRRIASERIRILFNLAERYSVSRPEYTQRYVALARKIASRNRIHLPRELKHRVCPACKGYLGSATCHVRIRQTREPHIAVTCHVCGHITRMPLRRRTT